MNRSKMLLFLAVAVIVSAWGLGGPAQAATTPVTLAPNAIAPLTGLLYPARQARRSALIVKVEDRSESRPQPGLDRADVIYEEVGSDGAARLLAVYNSLGPIETVGPIGSLDATDSDLVRPLNGVVSSAGTSANSAELRTAGFTLIDEHNADREKTVPLCATNTVAAYCRIPTGPAPIGFYGRPTQLFARAKASQLPKPLFTYVDQSRGQTFQGTPVKAFKVNFPGGYDVSYQWTPVGAFVHDGELTTGWQRSQHDQPFVNRPGMQLGFTNVIVQFTPYAGNGNGKLIGRGDAWVFSNGQLVKGTWTKDRATQATQYTDSTGAPIALTPGPTWVELLPTGLTVDLTTG